MTSVGRLMTAMAGEPSADPKNDASAAVAEPQPDGWRLGCKAWYHVLISRCVGRTVRNEG
jgi:hypothetical protein